MPNIRPITEAERKIITGIGKRCEHQPRCEQPIEYALELRRPDKTDIFYLCTQHGKEEADKY